MKLSKLNCSRGAPMGRHSYTNIDPEDKHQVALERVPMIDGGYDCGGAYFGGGMIYAYEVLDADGEQLLFGTMNAEDWDEAKVKLLEMYPNLEVQAETGSIIEQTMEFLQNFLNQADAMGEEDEHEDTEQEISMLEDELWRIRNPR